MKKKWIKSIETSLQFKVSEENANIISAEFKWLENSFNSISKDEYKNVKPTSFPNIINSGSVVETKKDKNLPKEVIFNNASINVSEDKYITYPKKN